MFWRLKCSGVKRVDGFDKRKMLDVARRDGPTLSAGYRGDLQITEIGLFEAIGAARRLVLGGETAEFPSDGLINQTPWKPKNQI